jgi:hypothetical protein
MELQEEENPVSSKNENIVTSKNNKINFVPMSQKVTNIAPEHSSEDHLSEKSEEIMIVWSFLRLKE